MGRSEEAFGNFETVKHGHMDEQRFQEKDKL